MTLTLVCTGLLFLIFSMIDMSWNVFFSIAILFLMFLPDCYYRCTCRNLNHAFPHWPLVTSKRSLDTYLLILSKAAGKFHKESNNTLSNVSLYKNTRFMKRWANELVKKLGNLSHPTLTQFV